MSSKILNGTGTTTTAINGGKVETNLVDSVNGQMELLKSLSNFNDHTSSEGNIIYDLPKSDDCFYNSKPKSTVSVESLVPAAARLLLSKNRDTSLDDEDYKVELDEFENDFESSIPDFSAKDYQENVSYNDYGLEVIHEETASQMSSDSDQEQDRCEEFFSETIRQRKKQLMPFPYYDEPDHHSQEYTLDNNGSPSSNSLEESNSNSNDDLPIVTKHIKVPSDWDPEPLLQKLYFVLEPNKEDSGRSHSQESMAGHMQILSGNRKKNTFWNAWKKKFFMVSAGKLDLFEKDDCKDLFLTICLNGAHVDFLDPVEFVGVEKAKIMTNKIIGLDDGKGHYYVFQSATTGEAAKWVEVLCQESKSRQKYTPPIPISKNPSIFRDIFLIEIGSSNVRAGVLTNSPSLPTLFFPAIMSENESTGKILYGSKVYYPENRKNVKIRFPFEPSSKLSLNTIDVIALEGFLNYIFEELVIFPENYRFILTLHRKVDNKCRTSILQLFFNKFQAKGVLMCHQSIMGFYSFSAENGIVVDVGERTDILCLSQGFVFSNSWKRSHIGGHCLKHLLRQKIGPQENGLYLSTPIENLVLRYISENFLFINSMMNVVGGRKMSQDSQEVIVEMDLRDLLPFSNLIGVDKEILKTVSEGFFEPELFGLDSDGINKLVYQALQDCGVDLRKEMSQNIFIIGGCTLIPGFAERLEYELGKLCPPHLKPKVTSSPFRYHASFIGAHVLAQNQAFEKSILMKNDYDNGPGPSHWCA